MRGLVDFALDKDVSEEIERQEGLIASDAAIAAIGAKAHLNLGVLRYSQGNTYDAIGEFLMAIEIDPRFAVAYRKLGEIYVGLGDYEQAGKYALKASEFGDATLLESFRRYPSMQRFVEGAQPVAR